MQRSALLPHPTQVGWVAPADGQSDHFGNGIAMQAGDETLQRGQFGPCGFNDHQRFGSAVELALPVEPRPDVRNDIAAGRRMVRDQRFG